MLVTTIILKKIYLFFGVLATFHWTSKLYATLIMGNRFLGVQISIIWVVFAVKTVTLLWQPAKAQGIARECHSSSHLLLILIMITKGPQLVLETNILLLILGQWRLCTNIRTAYACVYGNESVHV